MKDAVELTPRAKKTIRETEALVKTYAKFSIASAEEYTEAADCLKEIKSKFRELDERRKSMTSPLDTAKKRIITLFSTPLAALENAEKAIKAGMLLWQQEQERLRRIEEARLAELQRKEVAKLEAKAEKAEEAGKDEKAEELRQQAEEKAAVVPVLAPAVEKIAGITKKTIWKYRIVDPSLIPRTYLVPNEKLLGETARSMKEAAVVPGVAFYSEESLSSGCA